MPRASSLDVLPRNFFNVLGVMSPSRSPSPHNSRCCLVVLGIDLGGCWHHKPGPSQKLRQLRRFAPRHHQLPYLQDSSLTHVALTAFAASLIFEDRAPHHNLDGEPYPSVTSSRNFPSRLPPRPLLICQ